jgi:hypothetical protein
LGHSGHDAAGLTLSALLSESGHATAAVGVHP